MTSPICSSLDRSGVTSNVVEEITKLKQQPGQDLLVFGSGQLVNALMQHYLIDEYRLLVYPIVLGSGKRLFSDANKANLKLVETKTFGSGVVLLRYQPNRNESKRGLLLPMSGTLWRHRCGIA